MSTLELQVGRARRRLNTNVFFHRAAFGVLLAAAGWSVLWLVERAFVLGIPLGWSVAGAGLVGLLIAVVGTLLARADALRAAVELDRAAGLKERISSALYCNCLGADEFAAATRVDAEAAAARVTVRAHLPYRSPEILPWSGAAVAAAVLLGFFMPSLNLLAGEKDDSNEPAAEIREAAKIEQENIRKELNDRLNKVKEMVESNPDLKDLSLDVPPLELPEKQPVTPDDVRREAAKKIDSIAEQLQKKKEEGELEGLKDAQKLLAQLEQRKGDDPASKLAESLASGDMESAKQAIGELQKKLEEAARSGDPQAKQKAAELQEKLAKLSDELSKLSAAEQMKKELENKAGLSKEDAQKLLDQLKNMDPKQAADALKKELSARGLNAEKLEELAKKMQQCKSGEEKCKSLSKALAQAANAMKKEDGGDGDADNAGDASAALSEAAGQLSEMEMSEQMMNELQSQLSELDKLRSGVCKGGFCNKPGDRPGEGGQGSGAGLGYGSRIGKEKKAHSYDPSKANVKLQGGEVIGQTLIDGAQMRGEAAADAREAIRSAIREAEDAVEREPVPRQYDRVVREYFERLAGLGGGKAADGEKKKP
ncbi:hypothetical protein RAS1_18480 [Phycisphaerae bacterium RAS1]|nr:hypothetical protein RAS1_18480 [Phycisphaerae bacterium RAS1]